MEDYLKEHADLQLNQQEMFNESKKNCQILLTSHKDFADLMNENPESNHIKILECDDEVPLP